MFWLPLPCSLLWILYSTHIKWLIKVKPPHIEMAEGLQHCEMFWWGHKSGFNLRIEEVSEVFPSHLCIRKPPLKCCLTCFIKAAGSISDLCLLTEEVISQALARSVWWENCSLVEQYTNKSILEIQLHLEDGLRHNGTHTHKPLWVQQQHAAVVHEWGTFSSGSIADL